MSSPAPPDADSQTTAPDSNAQPARSFDDIPLNALSAIHGILMRCGKDKAGFCAQHRDAAAFRSTCKAFHRSVRWPDSLKLAFHKPLSQGTCESLATMLSRHAASTLGLRLCIPESGHASSDDFHTFSSAPGSQYPPKGWVNGQWVLSLAALDQRVLRLEMPAVASVDSTISAVSCVLPCLRELVLHCSSEETDTFTCMPQPERDLESLPKSQLASITLTVPPGQPPFMLCGEDIWIDLSYLPELQHLLLSGPIVKDETQVEPDEVLFELPLNAEATITPGLNGRKPTRWARTLKTYSCSVELSKAIPYDCQYMEEDRHERNKRMKRFLDILTEIASDQMPEYDGCGITDDDFPEKGALLQEQLNSGLRAAMAEKGIRGRSDLLEVTLDPDVLVSENMEEFGSTCQDVADQIMEAALVAMGNM